MQILLLIGGLMSSLLSNAQNISYDWAEALTGFANNTVDMEIHNEFLYITGYYTSLGDFDPGPGTNMINGPQGYVLKLDTTGNFIWASPLGDNGNVFPKGLAVGSDGSVVVTGHFTGTVDFNYGPGTLISSSTQQDLFISKLDNSGDFLWANTYAGSGNQFGIDAVIDDNLNIYVSGQLELAVDFDPDPVNTSILASIGGSDVFIHKLTQNGDFVWAKSFGSANPEEVYSMALGQSNEVYVAGKYFNDIDLDPGPLSFLVANTSLSQSMYISKVDSLGNFIHGITAGEGYGFEDLDLTLDINENIYLSGYFTDWVNFDTGTGIINLDAGPSDDDGFILKLDSNWGYQWAKSWGGTIGDDYNYGTAVDNSGNVYNVGRIYGNANLDPNGTYMISNYSTLFYLQKLDSSGNFVWAHTLTGDSYIRASSILLDNERSIYLAGGLHNDATIDFDPSSGTAEITSDNSYNSFIAKYNQCEGIGFDTVTTCNAYTWIDNITYTINANPMFTIVNGSLNGCDSIVNLNLIVNSVYNIIEEDSICSGSNYTYPDGFVVMNVTVNESHTSLLTTSQGCDSTIITNIILKYSDTSVIQSNAQLESNQTNATYQWLDCSNNYSIITGEINQLYEPTITGNYAVQITYNGCIDTSACFFIDFIGLNENYINELSIYPNPTSDILIISGLDEAHELKRLEITSSNGELVLVIEDFNNEIDISDLAVGTYSLNIIYKDAIATLRFIKN